MKKSGFLVALIMLTIVVVSQNNKEVVFIDDFETYDPGGQLACQNPNDWSTWDIFPCGPEDAHISDMYSHSGINSVNIVEGNDNYYELNEYLTSGLVNVSMMIYIPIGNSAYYNAMSDCDGGTYPEWAFEIYFNTNGDGYLNAGGSNAATFNYNNDIWLYSELIIDLDIDHAYYYVDNNLIYDWQWTLGANGSGCQLQLAAVDFYGIEAASFFFDDFEINNGYVGCLTPPMNLSGPDYVAVGEDINLTWEFPDSGKCFELDSEMKKLSFPKENKYFEHFNIYRDGLVIGTSTELEYTDNIDIAGTYTYCITAVYDIGESECSNSLITEVYFSLDPPTNLMASYMGNYWELSWDSPNNKFISQFQGLSTKNLLGYIIYMDSDSIAFTVEPTYIIGNLGMGTHDYCITALYDEGESICSNSITVEIYEQLYPPTNFTGPDAAFFGEPICFTWDVPGQGEWIHWDTGENTGNGIGLVEGGTFFTASHWMPSDIEAYDGLLLTKMSFFPVNDTDATYTLKIWTGENNSTEIIMSQDIQIVQVGSWNEVILNNPIIIDATTEYWFGYAVTHLAGTYPAGIDDGPAISGFGDMVSMDGVEWFMLSDGYNIDSNWNIQIYIQTNYNSALVIPILQPDSSIIVSECKNPMLRNAYVKSIKKDFVPQDTKDLLYYNLYRNGELIGDTDCDTVYSPGVYTYCVTAVYDEGESICSNDWIIDLGVGINETPFNNIRIFPNPASDFINIKSDVQIKNIKVYNYAGQMILDKKTNNNFYEINTSQFETGIYFFRVETELGIVSERVIVQ